MSILSFQVGQAGLSGVFPSVSYIETDDTIGVVTTAGYLNGLQAEQVGIARGSMALVSTKVSASAPPVSNWYHVEYNAGDWSLVAI